MLLEGTAWDGLRGAGEQRLWHGADQGESREGHRGEA